MDEPDKIEQVVARACSARESLTSAGLRCYRLLDGYREGLEGVVVDRYGDGAVIRYRPDREGFLPQLASALVLHTDCTLVTARVRNAGEPPTVLSGTLPSTPVVARESELRFLIDFARAGNPGLYLDARPVRTWLLDNSADRRILNLFSFTGSLGIAAAKGGARSVTHVDSHGPTLEWARKNCELNGVAVDDRDFARLNVYQHLRKNRTKRKRYDGIILDPPPGPLDPHPSDRTGGQRGVVALAPTLAAMLEPGGWLICFFHHDERSHDELDADIEARTPLVRHWRATSGIDFGGPNQSKTVGSRRTVGAQLRVSAFLRPS